MSGKRSRIPEALVVGLALGAGLIGLGFTLGNSLIEFKDRERTVSVKGLSEREVLADIAIWPIQFVSAGDELQSLYDDLARKTEQVVSFLQQHGFEESEITLGAPVINDKQAYGSTDPSRAELRYAATRVVSVYTHRPDRVRAAKRELIVLGKAGIALSDSGYQNRTQYIFSGLNSVKPEMVEEATRMARDVAIEFAEDSESQLGKIKRARQGQFSITDRDSNSPHIKKVRVVNSVEYYLVD